MHVHGANHHIYYVGHLFWEQNLHSKLSSNLVVDSIIMLTKMISDCFQASHLHISRQEAFLCALQEVEHLVDASDGCQSPDILLLIWELDLLVAPRIHDPRSEGLCRNCLCSQPMTPIWAMCADVPHRGTSNHCSLGRSYILQGVKQNFNRFIHLLQLSWTHYRGKSLGKTSEAGQVVVQVLHRSGLDVAGQPKHQCKCIWELWLQVLVHLLGTPR
mmetsp:Transcript_95873/g.200395  ORF Transcript_95873/g.200395 Transcript_95873/m.200395 type:complete len:216 (+) Transcript_95873:816-1463(+)